MTSLDYDRVRTYWSAAKPSILGPYMMEGFGFPAGAGEFRFRAESKIVRRLIRGVNRSGTVLDLGAGTGYWSEHFARDFARVIAIEASPSLFEALQQRCLTSPNVTAIHSDVNSFEPEERYDLVFLGGLLMYLNADDAEALLRKIVRSLQSDGIILCRETTVRKGVTTRQGEYQAIYRSTEVYASIFKACDLAVVRGEMNLPYVLMQMGCESIQKWKKFVPTRLHALSIVGHLVYWGLRMGYPWVTHIPARLGFGFPELTNQFFVLQAGAA